MHTIIVMQAFITLCASHAHGVLADPQSYSSQRFHTYGLSKLQTAFLQQVSVTTGLPAFPPLCRRAHISISVISAAPLSSTTTNSIAASRRCINGRQPDQTPILARDSDQRCRYPWITRRSQACSQAPSHSNSPAGTHAQKHSSDSGHTRTST